MRIFTADIGGTSSRFACFERENDSLLLRQTTWLETRSVDNVRSLFEDSSILGLPFVPSEADALIIAGAGPVEDNKACRLINVDWDIEVSEIVDIIGDTPTWLINDFLAQAFATVSPIANDAVEILRGTPVANSPLAIIGAGTGLGKASIIELDNGKHLGVASEGGH